MAPPLAVPAASSDRDDPDADELRHRLSARPETDDDDDRGSEYEMLLDPKLPQEYETRARDDDGTDKALAAAAASDDDDDDDDDDENEAAALRMIKQGDSDEGDGGGVEDSPYPEVRAAVRNYDEDVACGTVRAWTIGLALVVMGAAMNTLFSLRQPSISVGPLVAQIIAWPLGRAWARLMPDRHLTILGVRWSLNPGPFTVKEHAVIVVMASVAFSVAYATDIILAQLVFYKQDFGLVFQLLLVVSTQSLGYGIAGLLRRFLVYPASMIWPGNLVAVSVLNAMYEGGGGGAINSRPDPTVLGGMMPRYGWFGLVTGLSFVWFFVPGFLAQFLSVFAFATWVAPQNVVVNQLFGGVTGLSILPITFDWAQITGYIGSPLVPPWHAIANTLIGVVAFFIVGSSVLHYGGAWYGQFLPISDSGTYDNTGARYNTSRILTAEFRLDEQAYRDYSPLFISTTFAMAYGLSFAAISSLVVHTAIYSRSQIWRQWRTSTGEKPDIHMKLMRKYREAPGWWYYSLFGLMLLLGLFTVTAYPTNLAWWAFLLAVVISFGFALPIGIIQAVTNNQIGLNVLTEFVFGYIQPGRPMALMLFKTFGYITMSQALTFVGDLKFGHYMKIPPRTMFMAQVVATTVSCFVQVLVLNAALASIPDVCTHEQTDRFTCPGGTVFFSASVIWGLIGPARIFSPGQIYSGLFFFFALGAGLPVAIYLASRRWPRSPVRHLMAPLIFGGAAAIPPATPLNYLAWGFVGWLFQRHIRSRYPAWWIRLNFLTSSGLDLGLALATLFVFLAFTLHRIDPPHWWGNDVVRTTMDFQNRAVQARPLAGEKFGPATWE